jgi:hypothetical protein
VHGNLKLRTYPVAEGVSTDLKIILTLYRLQTGEL